MKYILGLNAFHGDSSACLLQEGRLVAAAEEERFTRVKHWAGFPSRSIEYCLRQAGVRPQQIEHIAVNQDTHANIARKTAFVLKNRPDFRLVLDRLTNKKKRAGVADLYSALFPEVTNKPEVHQVRHHYAHLASAFLVSPFQEAAVVSVDGFGDFASTAWGFGSSSKLNLDKEIHFPHSLGIFYQAITQFLGFPHYGDEYKVMGLAPYGQPTFIREMRDIIAASRGGTFELNLSYFRHHNERVDYTWQDGAPHVGDLYATSLEKLLGPARQKDEPIDQRHRDLARSAQAMYEEVFFHLLRHVHSIYHTDSLALAGGCAMNSVANGKVYKNTPFKRLYVQAAAGDAGGAIGAALAVWNERQVSSGPRFVMDHAFWGPEFDSDEISSLITAIRPDLEAQNCDVRLHESEVGLCQAGAKSIAAGKVVGWFQGRMEWGPRALGNRSILGDPRRRDMKDILNLKIKRRESFRPFAPSVLREYVGSWFETDDDVPFMMQVYQIRDERRAEVPAVTHVDGSGRLQTVTRAANPRYYGLIEQFRLLTGVPMVLNTSFNENEPVVCTPRQAMDCFLRTQMDCLILANWEIVRR